MKTGHVYILKCSDGTFYTGVTNDVIKRFSQHQSGETQGYTLSRRPLDLVWDSGALSILEAIALEKQLKGWRREKKKALIEGRWRELPDLSAPYWKKIK